MQKSQKYVGSDRNDGNQALCMIKTYNVYTEITSTFRSPIDSENLTTLTTLGSSVRR